LRNLGGLFFFFFQAEDGIRDGHVTGVQTCALPIWADAYSMERCTQQPPPMNAVPKAKPLRAARRPAVSSAAPAAVNSVPVFTSRSEERRVGKECRSRWSPDESRENSRTVEQ